MMTLFRNVNRNKPDNNCLLYFPVVLCVILFLEKCYVSFCSWKMTICDSLNLSHSRYLPCFLSFVKYTVEIIISTVRSVHPSNPSTYSTTAIHPSLTFYICQIARLVSKMFWRCWLHLLQPLSPQPRTYFQMTPKFFLIGLLLQRYEEGYNLSQNGGSLNLSRSLSHSRNLTHI